MESIGEHNLRAVRLHLLARNRLHRRLRCHRHKARRLNIAMRRVNHTRAAVLAAQTCVNLKTEGTAIAGLPWSCALRSELWLREDCAFWCLRLNLDVIEVRDALLFLTLALAFFAWGCFWGWGFRLRCFR